MKVWASPTEQIDVDDILVGSFAVSIGKDGTVIVKRGAGRGDELLTDEQIHDLGDLLSRLTSST